ncbi:MAG: type II toxin-antitoxin system Phd/YefM family antitoxin [Opitutales bacterium]|nr:type II toxin-antitoxin system Phd/YefM family antitoxin [Opitutales bacterium]NRA27179.1 type II toxin-antitoxin system Phd/YefM family antitoxin [Opitutales bacterium]
MKLVKLYDAKNRFSEICAELERTGETVVVTKRGKPVARLVPADKLIQQRPTSVWDTVQESKACYGPIEDEFELPVRDPEANRPSPFEK